MATGREDPGPPGVRPAEKDPAVTGMGTRPAGTASRSSALPLQRMFDSVHRYYDRSNRVLTLGCDQRWRRRCIEQLLAERPRRVLDLCCGTGDMALWLARLAAADCRIVALDFSRPMLETARAKAERLGPGPRIEFVEGDAAALPFPAAHFDGVTLGFAFRNLTYHNPRRERCLAELHRVLRPGGHLVFAETSQPAWRPWRAAVHLYHRLVVRHAGAWLGGNRDAYRYLAQSAADYLSAPQVVELLSAAGFREPGYRYLLGGVAAIFSARA